MTADVVFVVQRSACNKDILDKLKEFATSMDNALKAEGLKSNQFAVVGYGGEKYLAQPQVQTMDGLLFNTAQKLPVALSSFDLKSGPSADTMAAVRYAAGLPFRAGSSKTIVVVPCGESCEERTVRYSELQRLLLRRDVRLHMLIPELVKLKTNSPKTAYIFGVDESTVYTSKDVAGNDLAGERDLRKYIRLPKDLCVALTQDTEGSVFSARQWLDSRPLIQKKFTDVLVRAVARKARPTECQICECVPDKVTGSSGVSQCTSCSPRSALYTLMPNFYAEDFTDEEEKPAVQAPSAARPPVRPPPSGRVPPPRKPPRVPVQRKTPPPPVQGGGAGGGPVRQPQVIPQVKQE
jgi:hypothetical protein